MFIEARQLEGGMVELVAVTQRAGSAVALPRFAELMETRGRVFVVPLNASESDGAWVPVKVAAKMLRSKVPAIYKQAKAGRLAFRRAFRNKGMLISLESVLTLRRAKADDE